MIRVQPLLINSLRYHLFFIAVLISGLAQAQQEHNFAVAHEKTDCDSLKLTDVEKDNILAIRNGTFRVAEKLSISRYHEPNYLEFFSCDGKTGFIIAGKANSEVLYLHATAAEWDSLTNTDDPLAYYHRFLKKRIH